MTDEVYRVRIRSRKAGGPLRAAHTRIGVFGLSISSDTLRGHTDTIILTQLMRGDNYGYEINKTIQQRTGGQYGFKEATLYTAFKRLEQSGLISSYWGEDGPGARRRYYAITEAGRQRWEENRREWHNTRALLDALIDPEEPQRADTRHTGQR